MADIYSILSDETLDKIAAGGDLYESMTDNELDAVIAMGQQETSPAPAAPAVTSLTMPTTEGDLFPVEQTSDIEEAAPQYEQNRVGAKIGQIQNIISPEDAKSMSAMGAGTKGALRVQQQGGPTAYDDDGSISSWLGNMWNTIAYNSSGKVTAKSTNRHLQSILRGTVKVDDKEVPLTQLPDEALDDLADSAGWNGWKGWLFGIRSDDNVLQHWDRTTGANIKDPVARKAARIKYAQDVARGMVEQQESEKMAASVELENRPKHFGADVGAGFAETASYMAPYMIPHTYGIVAGLIEAGDRANELLSDAYEVDSEGNIRIKALRDSTGAAIAKGAARGVVAPLVERFGGDLAMGMLGKIPLVKSMGDKIVATTAGKAVDKWVKSMSRLGKYTGMQSMPAEMIEEFEDQVLDAGLGLNLREGEKVGTTALSRAGGAAKEFFTLDNLQELAESMILIQVLGGGAAYMNDRRITKHLDNLIANEAGIGPKDLAGFSLEEKQAAYQAFVEGLSEAEVSRRFNRGAEAINKLANSIREGRDWMDDFRDSAMRMMDEDSSTAPAQPQDTSPRMTKGDILTAAEAKQQEMEWEMLPPEKANEVAPGTIVVLPDGTKLMRQKRGVVKWGIVGAKKNSIALADSAAEKLLENGFRIFSKDKKGKQNETRTNEAQPQSEQTQSVVPPAGETARPVEAGEAQAKVGGEVASTETPITPPTSTPTETKVNTSPTTNAIEDLYYMWDAIRNMSGEEYTTNPQYKNEKENAEAKFYAELKGVPNETLRNAKEKYPVLALPVNTELQRRGESIELQQSSKDKKHRKAEYAKVKLDEKTGLPEDFNEADWWDYWTPEQKQSYSERSGLSIKEIDKRSTREGNIQQLIRQSNVKGREEIFRKLTDSQIETLVAFNKGKLDKKIGGTYITTTEPDAIRVNGWGDLLLNLEHINNAKDKKIIAISKDGHINTPLTTTESAEVTYDTLLSIDKEREDAFNLVDATSDEREAKITAAVTKLDEAISKASDDVLIEANTKERLSGKQTTNGTIIGERAAKELFKRGYLLGKRDGVYGWHKTEKNAEGGSDAAESEEEGEDSVDIDYDPDLPPDSLEDESESSASVKDEILPLADLEEPLADEEEEVLSSEDLEKPTKETKVPKLLSLPDTQEKFDELTRRLHTPIAQGGVSEKSQKGKAVQAEIERMKKAGWKPSEAQPLPPTNRLRRADGTDPLADKTQTTTPTTAVKPIDNETTTTYNTETKTPPTSNNKGETTNEEPERTQEGSKDESTVQVTESGDDFSRLQEASRAMPDSERALYRTGRKILDADDLGRASSRRSEKRRGRIVDLLRRRVNASNGGRNLSGVKTLSTRKKGKVLEYFNFGRTDGQTFRDVFEVVRNYLPNGELVDLHDNYGDDVKCFLSEDGLCGFAVEADGNLVSVFSLRPGSLKAMKNSILAAGATHLDAYASKNQDLAKIYTKVLGFKVASRMDYNMDYDHDNIAANHGNPDVVFMVKPEKNQVIEEKHYGKDDYEVAQYNQKYQAKRRSHEDKLRYNRIKGGLDALKDNSIANKDSAALKQILADIDYMRKGDDAKWFMAFGLKDDSDILSLENAIQGRLNGNDIYALSQTAENDWRKVNFERLESENANERDAAFRALAKAYISNLNAYNKAQASQETEDSVKAELENRVKFLTSTISNMSESDRQKFNKLVDDAESDLANKGTTEYQEAIGDRDELVTSEGERSDEENDLGAGGSGVTVNKQFEETESATLSRKSRSGSRDNGYISLEDGNVVWHNAIGDVVKKVPANVLDVVGKNNAEVKSLVDNLRRGQTVYMSVKDVESSIERDRRFTEDKDYQAWLKKQKANDAERMREKYEQESAKIAAGIGRNFIGGIKVEVVDREYIEGEDGENDRHLRDPKTKKVVGTWNRKTNELKLFRGANASTLVHELGGHAAYQFAQEQAAQGDKTLLNKMNECIDYALNSPKMKPLIEDIRSRYPEATEEVMRDEIFAALMERNSPIMQDLTKTLQGKAWYNRTWQAIKDAFRAMLTKMGFNKADLRGIDKMQPEEFMSWLDRTMAEGKNLGAIAGMDFGDGGNPTRKMQVGELGAYALGRTADRAKEMELAGTSRREIWDKTGWWKGRDGMWRFEIPDPAALKLTQDNIKALRQHIRDKGFVSMRLGNLKGMDDLLWAHPDLEDISFSIVPDKAINGAEGYYDEASNKILVSRRLLSDLKALNSTLVHEIQHAVQVREGFDTGASFDIDAFKNAKTEEERLAIANKYLNAAGETEARLTEARRNMTPEQRRATPPWEMYDVAEEEQNVGKDNGGRYEAHQLRKATTTTTATSFMDDTRSRGEKLEEKLIDSTAPIKSIQKEIDNHARANGEEGVEEVINADGSTDWRNSTDFIEAKDKENGHLERNLRELKTRYIDPAMEALAKAIRPGQERADLITDFNLYLQCKHAAARNRKIANDREEVYTPDYSEGMGMVTLSDGRRVGLSENVANQILAKMSREYGAKFRNFEDAAQSVYKMLEADLHNRHKSGLLSTEDWLKYMERRQGIMDWGTYIPLKTDLENTEGEAYRTFTTSLKRNEFMKAKGRGELDIADSPFAAAVLQAEQGIRRSSRNVLANVEANLAAKMNGGFVKNGLTDFTKTETDSDGMPIYAEVVEGVDARHVGTDYKFAFSDGDRATASSGASLVANRPDIHLFKRDGKLYAIRYRVGNNGRGIDVAKAFSGENMGHWGEGLQWVPRITHWLSSMRTQYSPEFTVSNMLADNLEALQALVGKYGLWDGGKAFMKSLQFQFRNARDLWRYVKTDEARGRVKSAIDAGILTKGGVVSQGIDAETKELTADLDKFIRKQKRLSEMDSVDMAKSFGRNVVDYISMANSFAEYSTRIGIVSALEEYGVPRKDAIKFARDATVNFNRKGTAMPYINGLYMFANAAVQGAMRSVQAFRDDFSNAAKPPKGQLGHNKHKGELVGMLVAIGVAKAILDNALGDDDDREKEGGRNARNLTEYDRKHNVGIPIGGGRQLAPLRFRGPYAAIPYLAQTFTRYALGDIDEGDVGAIIASELGAQTTDLLGGNGITNSKGEVDGSLLMQSIAPTLIDPVVQWATGKDYKGDNRLRRKFDTTMPASSNGKRSTPDVYKSIAQVINSLTGGNENRIGKLDIAPEDLQLITEFLGGAPMRDINNVVSSVKNVGELASGGAPDKTLSQMPFVRRVVREYPDVTGRYYDAIEMYERDKMEYKKTTRLDERRELRKSKPYLSTANTQLDKMIEQVKELTHLENGEVKRGRKWVAPKIERSEAQKNAYRKRRLRLQAAVLKRLGE